MKSKIFLVLVVIYVITFFTKSQFHNVDQISPSVLSAPIQTALDSPSPINFSKGGWDYTLTPTYSYEYSGLIVSKLDYRWFSLRKTDEVFPFDFCMIWGNNVESKAYQNRSLSFKQDSRFCWWNYKGNINLKNSEVSNTHLVVKDPAIEKILNKLKVSDQVRLKGKLVNVQATSKESDTNSSYGTQYAMQSSTTRTDEGAGACEVLLVESVEILQSGHVYLSTIHTISKYGFGVWAIWFLVSLFGLFYKKNKVITTDYN